LWGVVVAVLVTVVLSSATTAIKWLAIVGGVTAFAPAVQAIRGSWPFRGDPVPGPPVEVHPVEGSGENLFRRVRSAARLGDLDRYEVRVHFQLWTRAAVQVRNVQLSYDAEGIGDRPTIAVDRDDRQVEQLDGSFNMIAPRAAQAGSLIDVRVLQPFDCTYAAAERADYHDVTVTLLVGTPTGAKTLTMTGRLAPGGELHDPRLEVRP
jgi:hypothetical protein